jgi:hypothetical protein
MNRKYQLIVSMALLAVAAFAPAAQAQPSDRVTFLTFSAPVEIPGRVLPAGRYEIRLADDGETMDVVQVLQDNKVIGTYITTPTDSLTVPRTSYVTFEQRAPNAPPAIRAWFYPGDSIGQEFVYPKTRAVTLARASQQPVKTTADDMAPHMNAEAPAAQQQAVVALQRAPVQVAQPAGDRVEIVETTVIEMPKTAGMLPSQLLGGVALLSLALGLRQVRRLATAR